MKVQKPKQLFHIEEKSPPFVDSNDDKNDHSESNYEFGYFLLLEIKNLINLFPEE